MKILFLGGYGNISWWCVEKCVQEGHDVYILNRERTTSTRREVSKCVKQITCDLRDVDDVKNKLSGIIFDVVCDFICYNRAQAESAFRLFATRCHQYIFIGTESIYKSCDSDGLIREASIKYGFGESNEYINSKLDAELFFIKAFNEHSFPLTIIRPGYTFDTILPYSIGHNCYTMLSRCLSGKPLLIAGDGKNIWTFTHSSDFAEMFINFIGRKECLGEDYILVSENRSDFNTVLKTMLFISGISTIDIIRIPEADLKKQIYFPFDSISQRLQTRIFDTRKMKSIVPDRRKSITIDNGLRMTLNWLMENETRKRIVKDLDDRLERISYDFRKLKVTETCYE